MTPADPRIAVTPPAFCRSQVLRAELTRKFPDCVFNETGRYFSEAETIRFLENADAALVGRDPVNENVLKALPRLKIIAKYGVGLDNIDQEAMKRHQVTLGWTAGVNKVSVAELTLCFMLGLCHKVFLTGAALKQGQWRKEGGNLLAGKTVGIIGCGNVGKEVVRLLAPFDTPILVRDILDRSEFCRRYNAREAGLDEVIEQSDLLSLHVPLTDLTHGMVDESVFRRMRSTAFLINTSRGEVVDPSALKRALRKGEIAGAALDVFLQEPPDDPELLACPNLMATPHIGGNAAEAVEAMGRAAIEHLTAFFLGNQIPTFPAPADSKTEEKSRE